MNLSWLHFAFGLYNLVTPLIEYVHDVVDYFSIVQMTISSIYTGPLGFNSDIKEFYDIGEGRGVYRKQRPKT
jgi:hypothetical protein